MPFNWSRAATEAFINALKIHKCLWDIKSQSYRNIHRRSRALNDILNRMKVFYPSATINDMKLKIQNLRSQYRKELSRNSTFVREPSLWCFDKLKFLYNTEEAVCKKVVTKDIPLPLYISAAFKRRNIENDPVLQEQLLRLQQVFKPKEKKRYDWLGKQVIFRINQIHDEVIQMETVNSVQCILIDNLIKDNQTLSRLDNVESNTNATSSSLKKLKNMTEFNVLQQKVLYLKELVKRSIETRYDWLGKQVTNEVGKIKDEEIREDTAWAVQCLLRENVKRDKLLQHDVDNEETNIPEIVNASVKGADSTLSSAINPDCSDETIERFFVDLTERNGYNVEIS